MPLFQSGNCGHQFFCSSEILFLSTNSQPKATKEEEKGEKERDLDEKRDEGIDADDDCRVKKRSHYRQTFKKVKVGL